MAEHDQAVQLIVDDIAGALAAGLGVPTGTDPYHCLAGAVEEAARAGVALKFAECEGCGGMGCFDVSPDGLPPDIQSCDLCAGTGRHGWAAQLAAAKAEGAREAMARHLCPIDIGPALDQSCREAYETGAREEQDKALELQRVLAQRIGELELALRELVRAASDTANEHGCSGDLGARAALAATPRKEQG